MNLKQDVLTRYSQLKRGLRTKTKGQYLDLLGLNGEYNQRLIREVSLSAKTMYLGERRYLWIRRPTSQQLTINHLDRERL